MKNGPLSILPNFSLKFDFQSGTFPKKGNVGIEKLREINGLGN
jgi:hypothetical protein